MGRRGGKVLELGENAGVVGDTRVDAADEMDRLRSRTEGASPVMETDNLGRSFFGVEEVVNRSMVGISPGGNKGTGFELSVGP